LLAFFTEDKLSTT